MGLYLLVFGIVLASRTQYRGERYGFLIGAARKARRIAMLAPAAHAWFRLAAMLSRFA
jgi:hypothetical protein